MIKLGVEATIGHPGSGKTYATINKLVKHIKLKKFRYSPVYANMNLKIDNIRMITGWKGDFIQIKELEQIRYVTQGILILDEAHIWFPSQHWNEVPRGLFAKWAQCRKDELYIMITAQHWGDIYNRIRNITSTVYRMSSIKGLGFFTGMAHDVESGKISKKGTLTFIRFKKSVCKCYDTLEKIEIPEEYMKRKTPEELLKEQQLINSVKYRTKEEIIKEEKLKKEIEREKKRLKKQIKKVKLYNDETADLKPDLKRLKEFEEMTIDYKEKYTFDTLEDLF
jgi:hypothetical protein